MSPTRTAWLAEEICKPVGITCRYEQHGGRFLWVFWRNEEFVDSAKYPIQAIEIAEKLVDVGK